MRGRTLLLALLTAPAVFAQQTVAPTNSAVGTPRGENVGEYNILNSFELGHRWASVRGDEGKYRSDVNFGNGLRLLGSDLRINSRDGHGPFFDELLIRTQGLGNDPYQFSSLRVEKNRLYRYELTWRLNAYFNPALPIAGGLHGIDTERRLQDHDFTLLPQSKIRLFAGYSRNTQDGPALSTVRLFDPAADEFPLFSDVRRLQNVYRLGGELRAAGARITILRGWNRFSENTRFTAGQSPGLNPRDPASLDQFQRVEPYRGSSPWWNVNLYKEGGFWAANGRFTYSGGRRSFFFDELLSGMERLGATNRQILVAGDARRPVAAANLVLTLFPGSALTVSNETAFHNTRMDGDNAYREFNNGTLLFGLSNFQYLGIRTIANLTNVNYRATKWLGLHGGYRVSARRIRSVEQVETLGEPAAVRASQDNTMHAGVAGLRLRPVKPVTLSVDAEIGRADRPFFPISRRNYHLFGGRAQYRQGPLTLAASARANYNVNSVSLANHSSRSRDYGLSASWAPRGWFAFDAAYSKIHLDTLSALAYFAAGSLVRDQSVYISNIHTGTAIARFALRSRADFSLGYTRVQDRGDGRPGRFTGELTQLSIFSGVQTFPLTYEAPLARVSVKLYEKLRLNAGYQFYHYAERFTSTNYNAHTGYTSLLWSF